MIRQNIIINEHVYICDLYKADTDLKNSIQKEFVMLRKYDMVSDIIYDTDIYFVEKSIINEVIKDLNNKDVIVWPVPGAKGTAFTQNYEDYNSDYSEYTLCENGADLYKLYRQEITNTTDSYTKVYREAKVLCDKIRIYHPQTKVNLDYVIYVDNYINDIHFHYYCQREGKLEHKTENEFRYGTHIYSEFVEFYIPNIEDIISKDIFYKENINILALNDSRFIDSYKYLIDDVNMTTSKIVAYETKLNVGEVHIEDAGKVESFVDATGLTWHLVKDHSTELERKLNLRHFNDYYHAIIPSIEFEKLLQTDKDYAEYDILSKFPGLADNEGLYFENYNGPLNWKPVYDNITLATTKGVILEDINTNNVKITQYTEVDIEDETNTTLASSHLFTIPFKINKTNSNDASFPKYEKVYLPEVEKTIENNYLTYPICLTIYPYSKIDNNGKYLLHETYPQNSDVFMEELRFTLSSKLGFDNGVISIVNNFNYPNKTKYPTFKEAYEFYNNVSFDEYVGIVNYEEDDEDENEIEQKQCSFEITIASDTLFKQVIYHTFYEANEADDFAFNLNNIFDSWDNLPELLICRIRFVDKYLGTVIFGNNVIITKEYYKYCVNELNHSRVHQLVHRQLNYDNEVKITKDTDMNLKDINFIDKINCIITKPGESQTIYNVNNKPKIIYKPIFYRTQDLQNVKLISGMNQNIGINLADYMTKVSTFKMLIDGNTFVESARNDIFVIFRVDTTLFTNVMGTYHILNEDGDYISTGSWQINK